MAGGLNPHLSNGETEAQRVSKLVAKLGEDPAVSSPHRMLPCSPGLHVSILGCFRPERAVSPLQADSQHLPGHRACQAARKQFPSVNLAFHGPLARSYILSHTGPTFTAPSPSVCWRAGRGLPACWCPPIGAGCSALGSTPFPSSPQPPQPPLLTCLFPRLGKQGPFYF